MTAPLRLMVYDRTCNGPGMRPGLSTVWRAGATLYRGLGRFDAWQGVSSWTEALDWLASVKPGRPIAEVQYWGHGKWGRVLAGNESLDAGAFTRAHPLQPRLASLRARLTDDALLWFRTCEAFGTAKGHAFARTLTEYFGCRAAGHTYVIAGWQSGLHSLRPGETPSWSVKEGLPEGNDTPSEALWSHRTAVNTVTFLHGAIPVGY